MDAAASGRRAATSTPDARGAYDTQVRVPLGSTRSDSARVAAALESSAMQVSSNRCPTKKEFVDDDDTSLAAKPAHPKTTTKPIMAPTLSPKSPTEFHHPPAAMIAGRRRTLRITPKKETRHVTEEAQESGEKVRHGRQEAAKATVHHTTQSPTLLSSQSRPAQRSQSRAIRDAREDTVSAPIYDVTDDDDDFIDVVSLGGSTAEGATVERRSFHLTVPSSTPKRTTALIANGADSARGKGTVVGSDEKDTVADDSPIKLRLLRDRKSMVAAAEAASAAKKQQSHQSKKKKTGKNERETRRKRGRPAKKKGEEENTPTLSFEAWRVKPTTVDEEMERLSAYSASSLYKKLLCGQSRLGTIRMLREGEHRLVVVDYQIDVEIVERESTETPDDWDKRDEEHQGGEYQIDIFVACSTRAMGSSDAPLYFLIKYSHFPIPNWVERKLIKNSFVLRAYLARLLMLDLIESMLRLEEGGDYDTKYPNRYSEWEDGRGRGGYVENERSIYFTHLRGIEYRWNIVNDETGLPHVWIEDWTAEPPDAENMRKIQFSPYLKVDEDVQKLLGDNYDLKHFKCSTACKTCRVKARTKEVKSCCGMPTSHDEDADGVPILIDSGTRSKPAEYHIRIECSDDCGCDRAKCGNRDVQNGRPFLLVVFRTADKGWTVRTTCEIEEGAYVTEYVGMVQVGPSTGEAASYDCTMSEGMRMEEGEPRDPFTISAFETANESRFFAHSCNPNLDMTTHIVERFGKHYSHCAFHANRKVLAGEELTFSYFGDEAPEDVNLTHFFDNCRCGSPACMFTAQLVAERAAKKAMEEEESEEERPVAAAEGDGTPAEKNHHSIDEAAESEEAGEVVEAATSKRAEEEEREDGKEGEGGGEVKDGRGSDDEQSPAIVVRSSSEDKENVGGDGQHLPTTTVSIAATVTGMNRGEKRPRRSVEADVTDKDKRREANKFNDEEDDDVTFIGVVRPLAARPLSPPRCCRESAAAAAVLQGNVEDAAAAAAAAPRVKRVSKGAVRFSPSH